MKREHEGVFRWVCEDEYDGQPELSPGSCGVSATQREREPTIPFTHDDESDGQPEPVRFTQTIPTEPGFYWCIPTPTPYAENERLQVCRVALGEDGEYFRGTHYEFTRLDTYLNAEDVREQYIKEDGGLFGPKIEPPKVTK